MGGFLAARHLRKVGRTPNRNYTQTGQVQARIGHALNRFDEGGHPIAGHDVSHVNRGVEPIAKCVPATACLRWIAAASKFPTKV
jgi:hypothetical protein